MRLKDSYNSDGIRLWVTDQSDIEAEFCDPEFISSLTGYPLDECETWLSDILQQNQAPIRDQFAAQRAAHNEELYRTGGSPTNAEVWDSFQDRSLRGAKGKYVFKQLKNKVPANNFTESTVYAHTGYPERASSLKDNLQDLLA
jgi:hypothetical protein